MRVRFTAKCKEWWDTVLQYAEDTNREPSKLIVEAIDQIMARYPKRCHGVQTEVDVLAAKVAERLGLQVPAGTYISSLSSSPNPKKGLEDKELARETYAEGVRMTKTEYSALVGQYGEKVVKLAIQKVSAQQIKTGKVYKSPRGAVLQWGIRAALEEIKKGGGPADTSPACPECHVKGGNHGVSCSRGGTP